MSLDGAVDESFYKEKYHGEALPAGDFDKYVWRATDVVNQYCNYYFDQHSIDDLPLEADKLNVLKSICAEIEYLNDLGGTTELTPEQERINSASIGNFNYTSSAPKSQSKDSALLSARALSYLRPTGLLYRGLGYATY